MMTMTMTNDTSPYNPYDAIPYDDIDEEVRELVKLMNEVKGMHTIDSCFGHTDGRTCNHQSHVFVGVRMTGEEDFINFWQGFFSTFPAKIETETGWIQFSVITYQFTTWPMTRFIISAEHDPHIDERGVKEKLAGIELVKNFISDWNN